jgi:type I restriction enzyme S subunit
MGTVTKQLKKVPELRFGGFGDELRGSKLGKEVEMVDSLHTTPKSYVSEGYPMIRVTDVISSSANYDNCLKVTRDVYEQFTGRYKPVSGDIIMSRVGTCGAIIQLRDNTEVCLGQNTVLLKPLTDSNFLYHILKSTNIYKQVNRVSVGSTQKTISLKDIKKLSVNLPSLPEQQKIADFLESVDAWLDNLRQQKTALEAYKRGMMQKLFTQQVRFKDVNGANFPEWKTKVLGKIAKITTGNSNREGSTDTGKYRLFDRSSDERWSSDYELEAEALIVAGEGLVFKPKYYNGKFALHQRAYAVVNNGSDVNWRYLFYFITFNHYWFRRMSVGTTMPSLRMDAFTKIEINLPNEHEQQKIADFLNILDESITAKAEEITMVEQWKKGLMQKMFV